MMYKEDDYRYGDSEELKAQVKTKTKSVISSVVIKSPVMWDDFSSYLYNLFV